MLAKVTLFMNTDTEELMDESQALALAEEVERDNGSIESFIDETYTASGLYRMANDLVNIQGADNGGEVFTILEEEYEKYIKSAAYEQVHNSPYWKKYVVVVDRNSIQ